MKFVTVQFIALAFPFLPIIWDKYTKAISLIKDIEFMAKAGVLRRVVNNHSRMISRKYKINYLLDERIL